MPYLVEALPTLNRKALSRRKERMERASHIVKTTEPGAIALDLRGQRIRLGKRLFAGIPSLPPDEISKLVNSYCRVAEMILRLSRVPLAPPGSAERPESGPVPVLDLSPEHLAPDLAPSPSPEPVPVP